ncbi:MAG: hypothetical protein H6736_24925, partial [Alphaproteobacteria bacterium]|nr:hypothetical protein [Alphaproteobacteria bacterium]
ADGVTLLAIHVDPDRLVSITTEAGAEVEAPFAFPPFDPFAMFMGSIPDPPQPSDADYGLELTLGKGTTLTALEIFRGRMGRSERLWRDLSVRDRKARQCASDAQRLAHRFRLGTPKSNQVVDFTPGVRTLTWNAVHKSTSVVEASIEGGEVVLGYGSYDTLGPDDAGALKMFGRTYAMQGMKVYRLPDGFFAFRAPNGQFLSHGEPLRATDPDFPPPIEDDQKWRIRPVVNT